MSWSNYPTALANWNLSNGAATLVVTPLIITLAGRRWSWSQWRGEFVLLAAGTVALCLFAFDSVFEGAATNFAFLAFPVVIYAAVRFGSPEMSAILGLTLASVYASLAVHSRAQPALQLSETIWFVQAFTWVLAATGLLVAALVSERREAENRSLEASLREERARLSALRYQLNPHFLFNALNSLRAALPIREEAPRNMVTELSNYLRFTLTHEENDLVSLKEELRVASDYLAIERHRFGDELRVSTDVGPEAENVPVPILILQPLVENAIRHGFESSHEPFHLKISASIDVARLEVEIANTGSWKPPGEGTGLGLENVRRRLASLYRGDFLFSHSVENGWVRARISLPLRLP
jgi:sensor histidine kinase YesM